MITTLTMALLLNAPKIQTADDVSQSLGRVTKFLSRVAGKETPRFHGGCSVLGGHLRAGSSYRNNITAHDLGTHLVTIAGDDSADAVEVDVLDASKKSIVKDRVTEGKIRIAMWENAKAGTVYTIVVKNASKTQGPCFVGGLIMVESGGVSYPFSSISKATKNFVAGVGSAFSNGYGFNMDQVCLIGAFMPANASYGWSNSKLGTGRWATIVADDAGSLSISSQILGGTKVVTPEKSTGAGGYTLTEYKSPGTQIKLKSQSTKGSLVFIGIVG